MPGIILLKTCFLADKKSTKKKEANCCGMHVWGGGGGTHEEAGRSNSVNSLV